ncbi:MAG: 7,8-didemethyl-8-hydroxy-5-deazariboflavin synthase CofG, partial [Actinomycetota bacterium]|nr:7,8-didemethyl-8-hydroxy-5-deazariboflavin synthase CofG [Actinomycetota bacterium]
MTDGSDPMGSDAGRAGASSRDTLERLRRRALRRAEQGLVLSREEAAALLTCRGLELERLCAIATRIREAGGRRHHVTFSRKVFIPLTHLCRDACGYCTFAWPPRKDVPAYLSPDQVLDIARQGQATGCKEALFTLGDKPELRYPAARTWLEARGYNSTLEYLRAVAIRVIEETGLLPHLNPGIMTWSDLATLKQVSASMGLMLESTSRRLLDKGEAHWKAPDKDPAVRLRTIEDAGRLSVPFTSGLLIGIGETFVERADTVFALRDVHRRYGHIQEVIVQNFRAKPDTAFRDRPEPSLDDLIASIAMARIVMGPTCHVQAPPNLSPDLYPALLGAGIDDWGGVSPITPDHVNPGHPWPHLDELAQRSNDQGFELTERLTAYPEYVTQPDPWLAGRMRGPVKALATPAGLARLDHRPEPHPWQDPDDVMGERAMSASIRAVVSGDETGGSAADGRNARSADDPTNLAVYG